MFLNVMKLKLVKLNYELFKNKVFALNSFKESLNKIKNS